MFASDLKRFSGGTQAPYLLNTSRSSALFHVAILRNKHVAQTVHHGHLYVKDKGLLKQVTIRANGNADRRQCSLRDCSSILAEKDIAATPVRKMASLNDAIKILKSGRLREGMEILEGFVRDNPEKVNVLYNPGICYSELGNIDKSIEPFQNVALAPEQRRYARSTTRAQTGLGRRTIGLTPQTRLRQRPLLNEVR